MTIRDLVLAIEGLRERDKLNRDLLRRATYITAVSGWNAKMIIKKFDHLWPVEKNNNVKNPIRDRAYETLRRFREQEKEIRDKQYVKSLLDG